MRAITPGTWNLDAAHSDVDFVVRHAGISKVRGTFHAVEGQLAIAEQFAQSSVDVTVDVASISTKNEGRDAHLRSADFFDAEANPEITFVSTGIKDVQGDEFVLVGDLTIKGITKPVTQQLGTPLGPMRARRAVATTAGTRGTPGIRGTTVPQNSPELKLQNRPPVARV